MCAICGIVNFDHSEPVDPTTVERMTRTLVHRGPDDAGIFVEGRVGLGFRRLSIIDLSGGQQPIFNEDGSAAIVFNGEIYNYRGLATELSTAGHTFSTRSDTETILHAYEQYGDDCVQHLRGMFAFAIWDQRRQRLFMARDRLGIKPLYYYRNARFLAFASEIKALLEIAGVPRDVDPESFDQFLSQRYVPGPRTMFKDIFRLQPGHTLVVDLHQGAAGVHIRQYWDIDYSARASASPRQIAAGFEELLDESVRLRLISEVPLGLFLSGGLDSSAILAKVCRAAAGQTVKTFGVGYVSGGYQASSPEEEEVCELKYARIAARAFGADHHELRVSAKDFADCIPDLVWHLDEPLADPSCIPLYFVSKLAREHITVVLSGEGADELLAGYGIYPKMLALDRMKRNVPVLARLAGQFAQFTPAEPLRRYMRMAGQTLEDGYRGVCRGFGTEARRRLIGEDRMKRSDRQLSEIFRGHFKVVEKASPLNRMLYVDTKVWLPDDLLLKADKMTMAHGLELRVPFLDHKLVEFAAALPEKCKLNGNVGKSLLRKAMRGVLPEAILKRPKNGFSVPIASWLRGPLRQFTRDHLLGSGSACNSWLDRAEVKRIVEEHEQGRLDRSQEIWTLLVFEFWHAQFIDDSAERRRVA
jgi:asparagine synthase (glutamine-hydrolysing)